MWFSVNAIEFKVSSRFAGFNSHSHTVMQCQPMAASFFCSSLSRSLFLRILATQNSWFVVVHNRVGSGVYKYRPPPTDISTHQHTVLAPQRPSPSKTADTPPASRCHALPQLVFQDILTYFFISFLSLANYQQIRFEIIILYISGIYRISIRLLLHSGKLLAN